MVYAHPLADSFVAAVRRSALSGLEAAGHEVDLLDLDAEAFEPCLSLEEWRSHRPGITAKPADVQAHAVRLQRADALVLVYPTWWGAQPAIIKGWLDRVWVEGVAYTLPEGATRVRPLLRNIRHLVAVTTHGSPKRINAVEGEPGKRIVLRQMRALCHRRVRTRWLALYGVDQSQGHEREAFLARVEHSMAHLEQITGARGRLRPATWLPGRR
jgi:NAD(P)H dehydrogenase (quinone)